MWCSKKMLIFLLFVAADWTLFLLLFSVFANRSHTFFQIFSFQIKYTTTFSLPLIYIQWNLDTALILLLSQFLIMPNFFPSLSLLIKPQYSVIFTTSILLQHQFFCKPKTFFSYIFQPRYNINLKNGIFTIDKRKW